MGRAGRSPAVAGGAAFLVVFAVCLPAVLGQFATYGIDAFATLKPADATKASFATDGIIAFSAIRGSAGSTTGDVAFFMYHGFPTTSPSISIAGKSVTTTGQPFYYASGTITGGWATSASNGTFLTNTTVLGSGTTTFSFVSGTTITVTGSVGGVSTASASITSLSLITPVSASVTKLFGDGSKSNCGGPGFAIVYTTKDGGATINVATTSGPKSYTYMDYIFVNDRSKAVISAGSTSAGSTSWTTKGSPPTFTVTTSSSGYAISYSSKDFPVVSGDSVSSGDLSGTASGVLATSGTNGILAADWSYSTSSPYSYSGAAGGSILINTTCGTTKESQKTVATNVAFTLACANLPSGVQTGILTTVKSMTGGSDSSVTVDPCKDSPKANVRRKRQLKGATALSFFPVTFSGLVGSLTPSAAASLLQTLLSTDAGKIAFVTALNAAGGSNLNANTLLGATGVTGGAAAGTVPVPTQADPTPSTATTRFRLIYNPHAAAITGSITPTFDPYRIATTDEIATALCGAYTAGAPIKLGFLTTYIRTQAGFDDAWNPPTNPAKYTVSDATRASLYFTMNCVTVSTNPIYNAPTRRGLLQVIQPTGGGSAYTSIAQIMGQFTPGTIAYMNGDVQATGTQNNNPVTLPTLSDVDLLRIFKNAIQLTTSPTTDFQKARSGFYGFINSYTFGGTVTPTGPLCITSGSTTNTLADPAAWTSSTCFYRNPELNPPPNYNAGSVLAAGLIPFLFAIFTALYTQYF